MIRQATDVAYRELASDGGAVLLRLDNGQYHGINQIGRVIWGLIGNGVALDDLVTRLDAEVEGAPESLRDEVERFVQDLSERGLLVVEDQE
jgi:hypothetical protein